MTKTEFQREERYVVFKVSDLGNSLKGDEIRRLAREYAEQRRLKGKEPLECVVVEKDWPEYEPTWEAIEARVTGAQPEPSFADAYQGAMEEGAIWKKRALEAEDLNRKFVAEINGPTYMGGPAQPLPSVPREAIEKMLTQLMDIAVSNGANSVSMPDEYVEVAAWLCGIPAQPAPSVPDGWKLVPSVPDDLVRGSARLLKRASGHLRWLKKDTYQWQCLNPKTRRAAELLHSDIDAMLAAAPEAKP